MHEQGIPAPDTAAPERSGNEGLRWLADILGRARMEFGIFGKVSDVFTLLAVANSTSEWPPESALEDIERLEVSNGFGHRGFGMIWEDRSDGGLKLTPKGQAAYERIIGTGGLIPSE